MKEKIAILRWESGHVPIGLLQLEKLAGNSTNPRSYPFEVKMVEVPGANSDTIIFNPSEEVLNRMIEISRGLIADGVRAITTSCGFNAGFQKELSEALPVPVFTSSLLQVPFVSTILGPNKTVGILTANKKSLKEKHLRACGITEDMKIHLMGLETTGEWSKIHAVPEGTLDLNKVADEIIEVVREGMRECPDMGALVLECTDLPPYSKRLREELGIPVFDFNSMITYVAQSLNIVTMYENDL